MVAGMWLKLASVCGLLVFLGLAWALSEKRRLFPWRTVVWGLALQVAFALLILRTGAGRAVFDFTGAAINRLVRFSDAGCKFVFGPLGDGAVLGRVFGAENAFVFAVTISGTIILVGALSSLFYHWGLLQKVVHGMAWVMRQVMGTSGSETLSAAANVFMGQTEAPLLIRPYIPRLTRSEMLAMMTGGMATIGGGVAAVYVQMATAAGHPDFAGHLLTASVLNAPAGLLMAKIMIPETEASETAASAPAAVPRTTANAIDALCRGAGDGLQLALNVIGMLIAFVAVVELANFLFTWAQAVAGVAHPATLQAVLGWANAPFAWLMGVPWQDCRAVGQVLGERIVLNEFFGYVSLNKATLDPRSYTIATYALCGFANFASIAIQVGGIGSLAPERRGLMATLGVRAMVAGLLACYVSACVAGILL